MMYIRQTYSIEKGFNLFYNNRQKFIWENGKSSKKIIVCYFLRKVRFASAYDKECKEEINKIDSTKQAFYPAASLTMQSKSLPS
ncbi:hypothetical protein IW22_11245 [Chryseobacterium sp. JM1]|nr:hypothetical protein IW22_11245 [Chryseobacterium sp. JM1]